MPQNSPLTVSEAAVLLNVSEGAARRLVDDRKLHHIRVGPRLLPVMPSNVDTAGTERRTGTTS
jgi:excisionase family DNA binding protein